MVHSSLHVPEQDGKVGDSGWLENGELGVVPEVRRKIKVEEKIEEAFFVVQTHNLQSRHTH